MSATKTGQIELCKQVLTDIEKEHGIRCPECNRIMTNDPYYCRRETQPNVYEVICADCGLSLVSPAPLKVGVGNGGQHVTE